MGRYTAESTGMKVLRPMAAACLNNPSCKNKVWSDAYESWGFFGEDATMFDEFVLWCSIRPGDRITLDPPKLIKEFFTVVDIKRDIEVRESPIWIFKLLGPNSSFLDVKVKEKELFAEAMKYF